MNQRQTESTPPPVSEDQQQRALDAAVNRELMAGGRLMGRAGPEAIVAYGGSIGNWIGVLLTAGVWLLFYPGWKERRYVLAVNEAGRVWRRYANKDDAPWERVDE